MPSQKKKNKGKKKRSKRPASIAKRRTKSKAVAKKKAPKKSAKKKAAQKKRAAASRKRVVGATRRRAVSGGQSGDLQGLSRTQRADSESVDELVEEGNVFEAGAVSGVEEADDSDEQEVHTHEVPEDDVPEEYLDKD
jgi:hypothetical protein